MPNTMEECPLCEQQRQLTASAFQTAICAECGELWEVTNTPEMINVYGAEEFYMVAEFVQNKLRRKSIQAWSARDDAIGRLIRHMRLDLERG